MYGKINNCNTLMELKECLSEFEGLAIKDGMYDLKYPVDLRRIHEKLIYQIEILEKQSLDTALYIKLTRYNKKCQP